MIRIECARRPHGIWNWLGKICILICCCYICLNVCCARLRSIQSQHLLYSELSTHNEISAILFLKIIGLAPTYISGYQNGADSFQSPESWTKELVKKGQIFSGKIWCSFWQPWLIARLARCNDNCVRKMRTFVAFSYSLVVKRYLNHNVCALTHTYA